MAEMARAQQVVSLDVFLTAPGRQAENSDELVTALSGAAGVLARVLTKDEEGTLAYRGAVLTADVTLPSRIAVCDVGGASTEIAVGDPATGPDWIASVDLGSVRLSRTRGRPQNSRRQTCSAPSNRLRSRLRWRLAVARARHAGWSARTLGPAELAEALALVGAEVAAPARAAVRHRPGPVRRSCRPGVILLAEVQRKLGVPLHVCDGGIREGAVLASLEALAA